MKKVNNNTKKVKRKRIRFGRVFLSIIFVALIVYLVSNYVKFPLKSIFIYNNQLLSDQEIIDMAGISNYPSIFDINHLKLEKKLKKNIYIKDVKIKLKHFREIDIYITENTPLFYNSSNGKTVFLNAKEQTGMLDVPVLINYVPDTIYSQFVEKMGKIDYGILNKISEIKYDPSSVDDMRFLLLMTDGNYAYLTLDKFTKINKYSSIMEQVLGKYASQKGIIYLDEGEYFEVLKD